MKRGKSRIRNEPDNLPVLGEGTVQQGRTFSLGSGQRIRPMPDNGHDLTQWLRKTIKRLSQADTPANEELLARPAFDDPAVQRRIGELIGKIALEPKHKRHRQMFRSSTKTQRR